MSSDSLAETLSKGNLNLEINNDIKQLIVSSVISDIVHDVLDQTMPMPQLDGNYSSESEEDGPNPPKKARIQRIDSDSSKSAES